MAQDQHQEDHQALMEIQQPEVEPKVIILQTVRVPMELTEVLLVDQLEVLDLLMHQDLQELNLNHVILHHQHKAPILLEQKVLEVAAAAVEVVEVAVEVLEVAAVVADLQEVVADNLN